MVPTLQLSYPLGLHEKCRLSGLTQDIKSVFQQGPQVILIDIMFVNTVMNNSSPSDLSLLPCNQDLVAI
jgi:hypothetical protein